jgi:replicative DNA helicase
MDVESALISKIVTTGNLEDVVAKGIRADHFASDDCRDLFLFLTDHTRRYKTPPTPDAVRDHIEDAAKDSPIRGFVVEPVDDQLPYLTDRFIVNVKRRMANDHVMELAAALDDPQRSKNIDLEFLEVSRKLATVVPSTSVARFSDMEKRIDEYERRVKEGDTMTGVPFGFPRLDTLTGGIQPHEFVTIAGFSGLGKSTLLGAIAFNAWVEGFTPLYISLEMEAGAILRRFDAMAASLDYKKLKQLGLPPEQMDKWRDKAKQIREHTADIPIIDSIRHCTPDHVFAETVRHKPDLVVVDYLSLMKSNSASKGAAMWQTVTEITQDLKQNARTLKIPVVAAAQTNRSGGKDGAELDNIGYSMSVVQDSDIVLGLYADEDMKERKEMEIRLRKNRDGALDQILCKWDHENMLFREKTMTDTYGRPGPRDETPEEPPVPAEPLKPNGTPAPPSAPTPRARPKPRG